MLSDWLLTRNLVPDFLIRHKIRALLAERLRDEGAELGGTELQSRMARFTRGLSVMPVAVNTADSRRQHYEVPTEFYRQVLGPRMKYSSCHFERGDESLEVAEEDMLALYAKRARLTPGQSILELGCGWGSLSLWLAEHYPESSIVGVSHSRTQKAYIDEQCRLRGLRNLQIITCDMNDFKAPPGSFDRVLSVEMFEHMKNWGLLFERISSWLRPDGLFFMHIFAHKNLAYHFEDRDESDWMSRHFFTGGMMPSLDLPSRFSTHLGVQEQWLVDGRHYQRTAELWLSNMDRNRRTLEPLLRATYGPKEATRWLVYWRIFFMSCAELWGYRGGSEWVVGHYLLSPRPQPLKQRHLEEAALMAS